MSERSEQGFPPVGWDISRCEAPQGRTARQGSGGSALCKQSAGTKVPYAGVACSPFLLYSGSTCYVNIALFVFDVLPLHPEENRDAKMVFSTSQKLDPLSSLPSPIDSQIYKEVNDLLKGSLFTIIFPHFSFP